MESGLKFAAINIGSNAIRLLLSAVFETLDGLFFKKISLIRMRVRLGVDAFSRRRISKAKADQPVQMLTGYNHRVSYALSAHGALFSASRYHSCRSDHRQPQR